VVIETSGLADPAPILQTLMIAPNIAGRMILGGVVTTVDAVNGPDTLVREEISAKQVAVADRLIMTKTDLAAPMQPALIDWLRVLNASAPVLYAHHGKIDPKALFDETLYNPLTKSFDVQSWLGAGAVADRHTHTGHDIDTYAILREEPIRAVALTLLLEALAEHCGGDLLRFKGIVNILESPDRPAVIHGVQHVFHPPSWLARWPSDDRRSRMVFITRGVPCAWVEALLEAVNAEVATASATGN
jgi:G3E family GTPase